MLISSILAMSLCLIWGYGGILSLGQASFYCIRRICLRHRRHQSHRVEREHASGASCGHRCAGAACRRARPDDVLQPPAGRLCRDPHSCGLAAARPLHAPDRRSVLHHRQGCTRRHERLAPGGRRRSRRPRPDIRIWRLHRRVRRAQRCFYWVVLAITIAVYHRPSLAGELELRVHPHRLPRGSRSHRNAGIRYPLGPALCVLPVGRNREDCPARCIRHGALTSTPMASASRRTFSS